MKRSRELEDELDPNSLSATRESYSPEYTASSRPVAKVTHLDSAIEDDDDQEETIIMRCNLPPHKEPLTFRSYDEYEVHYNKAHTNRCLECHRNFPTDHLLTVHIEEFHDPLISVKREKGEHTYSCFVEGCERKCLTHQKRRLHLIDKHMYPKNFFFGVTKEGIDGRRSLLNEASHHRRRSSTNTQTKESRRRASLLEAAGSQSPSRTHTETKTREKEAPKPSAPHNAETSSTDDESADADMEELTGAMSSLQFVPPSIRFGRGTRAGFSKK
ncbi:hypothetical protein BGZ63DRAFT_374577 [Mariannaea sp. PMI_226]|nr:hypothetical protein BGZ63DRAFT_374577 [Mariannaea sp. PMI_226]